MTTTPKGENTQPQTMEQFLLEVADMLEQNDPLVLASGTEVATGLSRKAAETRQWAEKVKGRITIAPLVHPEMKPSGVPTGKMIACIAVEDAAKETTGDTADAAVRALQGLVDGGDQ